LLNEQLRTQDRRAVLPWRDYIWLLLHAMRKLPPVPTHELLYRGVKLSHAALGMNFQKGRCFELAGFTSTTSNLSAMQEFGGDSGDRVIFHFSMMESESCARDISKFSMYPKECEILLPPNMMFEVYGQYDAGGGLTQLQCRQQTTLDPLMVFGNLVQSVSSGLGGTELALPYSPLKKPSSVDTDGELFKWVDGVSKRELGGELCFCCMKHLFKTNSYYASGRVPLNMISRIVDILHTDEFLFTVTDMCDFADRLTS
jgi:hypothetical protein